MKAMTKCGPLALCLQKHKLNKTFFFMKFSTLGDSVIVVEKELIYQPSETVRVNFCGFKLLSFWVICYIATDN